MYECDICGKEVEDRLELIGYGPDDYCKDCYAKKRNNNIVCDKCGKEENIKSSDTSINGKVYCTSCYNYETSLQNAKDYQDLLEKMKKVKVTTTNSIDGYKVVEYIDVISAQNVLGSGMFIEFFGDVSDLFGVNSGGLSNKLKEGKERAMLMLRKEALDLEADAILGIDLDYTEYNSNRTGVVVNGTAVKLEKIETD